MKANRILYVIIGFLSLVIFIFMGGMIWQAGNIQEEKEKVASLTEQLQTKEDLLIKVEEKIAGLNISLEMSKTILEGLFQLYDDLDDIKDDLKDLEELNNFYEWTIELLISKDSVSWNNFLAEQKENNTNWYKKYLELGGQ